MNFIKALYKNTCSSVIDYILPHRCFSCHGFISVKDNDPGLCADCFTKIDFITSSCCKICGSEFKLEEYNNIDCAPCVKSRPKYNIGRSLIKYNSNSKKLIFDFKYNDKTFLAKYFARQITNKFRDIISEADIITAVPMHLYKRLYRFYNPPLLLAWEIAYFNKNLDFLPGILIKSKHTKTQTIYTRDKRLENLKGSIDIDNKYNIFGKRILLVDDVHTTGATANYCSQLLIKHKALSVSFISIART